MQCPRCHFENIPGQDRCFRCSSVLEAREGTLRVHPPRMASRVRFWRTLARWQRRLRRPGPGVPEVEEESSGPLRDVPLRPFLLSIIPGLGHAVVGRFRQVRLWVVLWAILFGLAYLFYASTPGWVLLGLAASCHAWIALDTGVSDSLEDLGPRVITLLLTTGILLALYIGFPRWVLGLRFAPVTYDATSLGVRNGDVLMFRVFSDSTGVLPSGTIVLSDLPRIRVYQHGKLRVGNVGHRGLSQIVGGAGAVIALNPEVASGFFVDGQFQDPNRIPIPFWMRPVSWHWTVPRDHYFCSHDYQLHGADADARRRVVTEACMLPVDRIHRRAVMVWWPLHHRHRLP